MRLKPFLITLAVIALVYGGVYIVGQQVIRRGANLEPARLAEATAVKLKNGTAPRFAVNSVFIIDGRDQAFVVVYDLSGRVLAGGAFLNNTYPVPPLGVLTSATPNHPNKVTWQPAANVRLAAVVIRSGEYYIMGAKSLRVSESFQDVWLFTMAGSWLTTTFIVAALLWWLPRRLMSRV